MRQSMNLPLCGQTRADYGGWAGLRRDCAALGLDGIEGIWSGEDIPADFPPELLTGYHLTFFPEWLDFLREDRAALLRKFGSMEAVAWYYGGRSPDDLVRLYREDLERSAALGAGYVVFHVTDVSIEEGYTYRWLHSNREIIDAAAALINRMLAGRDWPFLFLMENQWWPGFTFTEPENTARLLEAVRYPRKGLLLDTGHLMNADRSIRSEGDGLRFIAEMLDRHGALCRHIRGMHLHQSVSGAYVRAHCRGLPPDFPADMAERYRVNFAHIQHIDQHRPWTDPGVRELVERVGPDYLTHELAAPGRREKLAAVGRQRDALGCPGKKKERTRQNGNSGD